MTVVLSPWLSRFDSSHSLISFENLGIPIIEFAACFSAAKPYSALQCKDPHNTLRKLSMFKPRLGMDTTWTKTIAAQLLPICHNVSLTRLPSPRRPAPRVLIRQAGPVVKTACCPSCARLHQHLLPNSRSRERQTSSRLA